MRKPVPPRYTVIPTTKCSQGCEELKERYERIDELIKAVILELERYPHNNEPLGNDYYYYVTSKLEGTEFPVVKVVYLIDEEEETVTILSITDKL